MQVGAEHTIKGGEVDDDADDGSAAAAVASGPAATGDAASETDAEETAEPAEPPMARALCWLNRLTR